MLMGAWRIDRSLLTEEMTALLGATGNSRSKHGQALSLSCFHPRDSYYTTLTDWQIVVMGEALVLARCGKLPLYVVEYLDPS